MEAIKLETVFEVKEMLTTVVEETKVSALHIVLECLKARPSTTARVCSVNDILEVLNGQIKIKSVNQIYQQAAATFLTEVVRSHPTMKASALSMILD